VTKMSLAEFRDSASAAAAASERRHEADRATLLERVRLRMEASLDGTALLLTAALVASQFDDFPDMISLAREGNGHNSGISLKRSRDGMWRVSLDKSLTFSSAQSLGLGYMGHTILVSYAMRAMGIPHSDDSYRRVKGLCDWGPDPIAKIDLVAASVPRHVLYSALGHGSDFARFIGVKPGRAFADGMVDVALKHRLGLDGGTFLNTRPALISCAARDDLLFVERLIARGASLEVKRDEVTPARTAAENCHLESLRLLAEAGANLNIGNSLSETLLHAAIGKLADERFSYRVEEVVEYLLEKGVNPKRLNHWGQDVEDVVDELIERMEREDNASETHLAQVRAVKEIISEALSPDRRPR